MSTKKTKTEFKQLKRFSKGKSEKVALAKAMQSLDCKAKNLETAHTEDTFIFRLKNAPAKTPATNEKSENLFTVEKDADYTLQDAKHKAMEHFNTFEGNIKIADQDETHIVFSKVRG